jgi:RNA polymerase sigma-70 factor (ECF subfamily)
MLDPLPNDGGGSDSPEAFAMLYRQETGWLTRFFRARLRSTDEAHDLVQETMLRFLRAAQTTPITTSRGYLLTIASNLIRDHVERGSTLISRNSVDMIEDMEGPVGIDPHWEQVIDELKPRTREIFLLSRVDGYSYKEIASAYGMTIWGVKKHMMKAIAHIDRYRREP